MKHWLRCISLLLLACWLCHEAAAQQVELKTDASTRALISLAGRHKAPRSRAEDSDTITHMPLILRYQSESAIDSLLAMGAVIYRQRSDMALTSVPIGCVDSALALDGITYASASPGASMLLDKARQYSHALMAQMGTGLPHGYSGHGIVAGFSDIGFDPHHVAFEGRVKLITHYDAYHGASRRAATKQEIAEWVTDNPSQFHATHVANIMAGSFMGNRYFGIAPGADIVATTSDLTDVGILAGVEDVIEYAQEHGQPAVINLSLGDSNGPHDGTDLMCQYLSSCAQEAVICLSAGNTGHRTGYANHLFSPSDSIARVAISDLVAWNNFAVHGLTDAWSIDQQAFDTRVEIYDSDTRSIVWQSPWMRSDEDQLRVNAVSFPEITDFLIGDIVIESGISSLNGRFTTAIAYDYGVEATSSRGPWARYQLAIAMRASEGCEIDIFSDTNTSTISAVAGVESCKPSSAMSISDLCTAPGVIAIGACSTRNTAPALSGTDLAWNFEVGAPANFSSYGVARDGNAYPHFCAPGNFVVSALSTPYREAHPGAVASAMATVGGTDYYWMAECGTSMSAPHAAGAIALWLEANPSLTAQEIIYIAQSSTLPGVADQMNPRWGAGALDVHAGLKQALSASTQPIESVKPIVTVNADRTLSITVPAWIDAASVRVSAIDGTLHHPHQPLQPGLYIISAPTLSPIKINIP